MHYKKEFDRLLDEKKIEEAEAMVEGMAQTKETSSTIEVYKAVIALHIGHEDTIKAILEKDTKEYAAWLYYAEYKVAKKSVEESIEYYEKALMLCSIKEEKENIVRKLVLLYVWKQKTDKAFVFAKELLGYSQSRYNVVLLWLLCSARTHASKETAQEMEKIEQRLSSALNKTKEQKEVVQYGRSIEVRAYSGMQEFAHRHKIELHTDRDTEVGVKEDTHTKYEKLLQNKEYKEVFEQYIEHNKKIADRIASHNATNPIMKATKVSSSLQHMVRMQDTNTLHSIAEAMYKDEYYACCIHIYEALLSVYSTMESQRHTALQMCVRVESTEFANIAETSVLHTDAYKESIKKYEMSVYLVYKGTSKRIIEIERDIVRLD